jgi:hypothetical protein
MNQLLDSTWPQWLVKDKPLTYFHALSTSGSGALSLDSFLSIFNLLVMSLVRWLADSQKSVTPVFSTTH